MSGIWVSSQERRARIAQAEKWQSATKEAINGSRLPVVEPETTAAIVKTVDNSIPVLGLGHLATRRVMRNLMKRNLTYVLPCLSAAEFQHLIKSASEPGGRYVYSNSLRLGMIVFAPADELEDYDVGSLGVHEYTHATRKCRAAAHDLVGHMREEEAAYAATAYALDYYSGNELSRVTEDAKQMYADDPSQLCHGLLGGEANPVEIHEPIPEVLSASKTTVSTIASLVISSFEKNGLLSTAQAVQAYQVNGLI
ncbi:MAG TPA: hypothetical protein VLG37_02135 [Candidatus Saccharimonadales bacterium]|nr:hypothetical protein [Candidatus Saccharimonadales bacterium]